MSLEHTISGVAPGLSSFAIGADLSVHLTKLTLGMPLGNTKAQLEAIGKLKALQDLRVSWARGCATCSALRGNVFEERIAWHLPQLLALSAFDLRNGELVLSCPKLSEARFQDCNSVHVKLEDAVLGDLVLKSCTGFQLAVSSPKDQFRRLTGLTVSGCSELGRHIIEDVGQMGCLESLIYRNFPAARMPRSFPQSL